MQTRTMKWKNDIDKYLRKQKHFKRKAFYFINVNELRTHSKRNINQIRYFTVIYISRIWFPVCDSITFLPISSIKCNNGRFIAFNLIYLMNVGYFASRIIFFFQFSFLSFTFLYFPFKKYRFCILILKVTPMNISSRLISYRKIKSFCTYFDIGWEKNSYAISMIP